MKQCQVQFSTCMILQCMQLFQLRDVHLINWRAHYVANNADEAVPGRAIKYVKRANEQRYVKLKMEVHQHKGLSVSPSAQKFKLYLVW